MVKIHKNEGIKSVWRLCYPGPSAVSLIVTDVMTLLGRELSSQLYFIVSLYVLLYCTMAHVQA